MDKLFEQFNNNIFNNAEFNQQNTTEPTKLNQDEEDDSSSNEEDKIEESRRRAEIDEKARIDSAIAAQQKIYN